MLIFVRCSSRYFVVVVFCLFFIVLCVCGFVVVVLVYVCVCVIVVVVVVGREGKVHYGRWLTALILKIGLLRDVGKGSVCY